MSETFNETTTTPPSRTYASWGRRLAAYLLDALIATGIVLVVLLLLFVIVAVAVAATGGDTETAIGVAAIPGYVLAVALSAAYFVWLHGREAGQTLGKMAVGIRVRDDETNDRIGYGRAFVRWFLPVIFSVVLIPWLLDYLWPLWDAKNQAWHDKIAGSVVVRA